MVRVQSGVQLNENDVKVIINEYVTRLLKGYKHNKVNGAKVIHDSVHGTNIFYPYEIAFLDLPIVQRLRRISQTDVASLVFPAGNHNRFEHTVGTTVVAGQMINSIFDRCHIDLPDVSKDFIYNNCRVAAILHDCGHGPYSHLSEQLYSKQFKFIKQNNPVLTGANAHEILSYFIVTSDSLKNFNKNIIKKYYNVEIDLDFVGKMIVGYINKRTRKNLGFATEIMYTSNSGGIISSFKHNI